MAASEPLAGRTLDDRYLIEGRIGAGGMGSVYRGRHLLMNRGVALKILRPDLAHDQNAARRFAREAKSAFRFDHPNCVRVSDFGITGDGLVYLVMELLDGRTVGDELHYDGPMSPARVAHVARQVCDALDHAHSLGLVHRDLKPDNVMLLERGDDADFVKVLDFGLAKLFEGPDAAGSAMFSMAALTQEGTVYGTPEYMSPEQATGQALDPRSDLYALGVLMYEMATGLLPFQKGNYMATLSAHVKEIPVSPAQRRPELGIPSGLDSVITRLLAKDASDRFQTAADLSDELNRMVSELAVPRVRVPREVAASETVDLAQSAVMRAEMEVPKSASNSALTTNKWAAPRRRKWLGILGIAAAVAAVAVAAVLATGRSAEPTPSVSPTGAGGATAIEHPVDGSTAPPSSPAALDRPDASPARRAVVSAKPVQRPPPRAKLRSQRREKLKAHLAAARRARSAGKTLKQIAEADSALRIDRGNARAAYLLGDGLLRSGDKANGCRYLKRAHGLRSARERARSGGCAK